LIAIDSISIDFDALTGKHNKWYL